MRRAMQTRLAEARGQRSTETVGGGEGFITTLNDQVKDHEANETWSQFRRMTAWQRPRAGGGKYAEIPLGGGTAPLESGEGSG
jgi:hypothetical protein